MPELLNLQIVKRIKEKADEKLEGGARFVTRFSARV